MTEVFPEDSGEFKCIVENEAGATSSSAWLFVSPGEEMEKLEDPQTTPKGQDFLKSTSCLWTRESLAKERDADTKLLIDEESSIPKEDNSSELSLHRDSILKERAESSRPTSISSPELIKLCSDSFQTPDFSSSPPITPGTSLPGSNNNCNNSPSNPSKYQPTMFNYERPKHFIQPQNTCSSRLQPPGPETSTFSTSQTKQSSILIHPRQCTEQRYSASSTVSSQITVSSSAFPASGQQLSGSSPGHRVTSTYNQSPASFLSSVLPSQPDYSSSKTPTAVESNYQQPSVNQPVNAKPAQSAHPKLIPKTPDHEIQGSKEALIQDLERKLRCKDNLLHNGNQRLTYEEKMARRLLGPQNAAAVFQAQNDSESQNSAQHNSENARLQVPTPQIRSRSSSRGDTNDQESILEKFYPPRFVQVPENLSMEEGRFCRIDFKVSGLPAPDVTWYLNGRPVQSDELHKMIVSEKGFHSLIFEVVRTSDAGTYACVAKNRAGEATFTIQLDVLAKEHKRAPMFIYKPQSKKVYEGDSVKLECQVSAIPPPKLFWKRNNEMVQFNTDRISLYHDNSGRITLLIKDANKKDAGWYTVSAVNEAGVVTCNTRLDVAARPTQTLPNPKQLRVRPTFSKYLALNGKGLDVKQAFNPEGEFQRLAAQSGLYESEEL
ncbi:myotilin isoform X2 [Sminthopsis crassicaudata]